MSEQLSQKLSKRLDELSVKVESEYCWWKWLVDDVVKDNCPEYPSSVRLKRNMKDESFFKERSAIPAPTFEELEKKLPHFIIHEGIEYIRNIFVEGMGPWTAFYENEDGDYLGDYRARHKLLREALGLLAIWLAENGHLKGE